MRQRDRNSAVAGATALALSVLAIGGAPRWAVVMLACLAAAPLYLRYFAWASGGCVEWGMPRV